MRSNNSITAYLILLLSIYSINMFGQVIDNKINIHIEYITGIFIGEELKNDGTFRFPALYSNLKNLRGFSFKAIYNIQSNISLGIAIESLKGSDWSLNDNFVYAGSKTGIKSISPIIQFHDFFGQSSISNSLSYFFGISPNFGFSEIILDNSLIILDNPLFEIKNTNGPISHPMKSNEAYIGVKGNAGIEYIINKNIGVNLTYFIQNNWINSKLYPDKTFTTMGLGIGLFLRYKKEKRYYN